MNQLHLRQSLGTLSPETLRRYHHESLVNNLVHQKGISFSYARQETSAAASSADADADADGSSGPLKSEAIAHQAGVNCLAIDATEGRYLFSGGADSKVRLWDLEENQFESEPQSHHHYGASSESSSSSSSRRTRLYKPKATLSRSTPSSHTHALTSMSIYPFDPTPATLLTTSYDKTLKVTSITASGLSPLHTFDLDFTPYTHALSPRADSTPLIAVGTAHPAIRLLDLRSGLSTHSMTGPNGAVYSIAWSPRECHILASGSSDGRVLFFDIRRANAAFASLDLDDAVGVVGTPPSLGYDARREILDFNAVAHNGPVTGLQWTPSGDKIVTTGHDQRIRVWDAATGRNDLVHFGPRIRNSRLGQLQPLISPLATHRPGRESLFWPNDDPRGFIFQHHLREGHMLKVLRTQGVKLAQVQAASASASSSASASRRDRGHGHGRGRGGAGGNSYGQSSSITASRLTGSGRINAMIWRVNSVGGGGEPVEMYTAHGDGRIGAWLPGLEGGDDDDYGNDTDAANAGRFHRDVGDEPAGGRMREIGNDHHEDEDEAENRRKRKRALIGDLVQGLTKRPVSFS